MTNKIISVSFFILCSIFNFNALLADPHLKDKDLNTSKLNEEIINLENDRPFEIKELTFEGIGYVTNITQLKILSDRYVGKQYSVQLGQDLISDVHSAFEVESVTLIRSGKKIIINCKPKIRLASIDIWIDKKTQNREQIKNEILESLKKDRIIVGLRINSVVVESCIDTIKEKLKIQLNCDVKILFDISPILDNKACILKISVWVSNPIKLRDMSIIGDSQKVHYKIDKSLPKFPLYLSRSLIRNLINMPVNMGYVVSLNSEIEQSYKKEGYLDANLAPTLITYSSNKDLMYVNYIVEKEGDKSYCGKISITGDTKTVELLKGFDKKFNYEGDICKKEKITEDIETSIKDYLTNLGYNNCSVECIFNERSDDSNIIDCKVFCRADQLVYVRNIIFSGDVIVYEKTLRDLLDTKENCIFYKKNLENDVKRLSALDSIQYIEPKVVNVPDSRQLIDVIFEVHASNSRKLGMNFSGISLQSFPISLNFSEPNFLGRGRSGGINLNARFSSNSSNKKSQPIGNTIIDLFKNFPQTSVSLFYRDNITFGKNFGVFFSLGGDLYSSWKALSDEDKDEDKKNMIADISDFLNSNNSSQINRGTIFQANGSLTKYSSDRLNNISLNPGIEIANIKYPKSLFNYQLYNSKIFDKDLLDNLDQNDVNISTFVDKLKDISFLKLKTETINSSECAITSNLNSNKLVVPSLSFKFDFNNLLSKSNINESYADRNRDKLSIIPSFFCVITKNKDKSFNIKDLNKYNSGFFLGINYTYALKRKLLGCRFRLDLSTLFSPFQTADKFKVSKCNYLYKDIESIESRLSTIASNLNDYRNSKAIFIYNEGTRYFLLDTDPSKYDPKQLNNKNYNSGGVGYGGFGFGIKLPTEYFWHEYGQFGASFALFFNLFTKQKDFSFYLLKKIINSSVFKKYFKENDNAEIINKFEKNYKEIPVFAVTGCMFTLRNIYIVNVFQCKLIFNLLYFVKFLDKMLAININKCGPFVLGGDDFENDEKDFYQYFSFDFSVNSEIDF